MSNASIQFDFAHKRVLITGGTSGMGEACAISFVKAGARVVISASFAVIHSDIRSGSVTFRQDSDSRPIQ